jgi:hypothetical protein
MTRWAQRLLPFERKRPLGIDGSACRPITASIMAEDAPSGGDKEVRHGRGRPVQARQGNWSRGRGIDIEASFRPSSAGPSRVCRSTSSRCGRMDPVVVAGLACQPGHLAGVGARVRARPSPAATRFFRPGMVARYQGEIGCCRHRRLGPGQPRSARPWPPPSGSRGRPPPRARERLDSRRNCRPWHLGGLVPMPARTRPRRVRTSRLSGVQVRYRPTS